jgi:hypothetical protein
MMVISTMVKHKVKEFSRKIITIFKASLRKENIKVVD